ncbi:MAG: hypothetical protein ACXW2E_00975 [Nitrososphaeraceae archaeon]
MILFEIMRPTPSRSNQSINGWTSKFSSKVHTVDMGYGAEATAYIHPNSVTKIISLRTDAPFSRGTIKFLRYCQKLSSNPYLPNIYRISFKRFNDTTAAIIRMERLLSTSDLPIGSITLLGKHVLDNIKSVQSTTPSEDELITQTINMSSQDKQLQQALWAVRNSLKAKLSGLDFNPDNFMWRDVGSNQFQLVFNDPIGLNPD